MRHGLRAASGAAVLLVTAVTGCSAGPGGPQASKSPSGPSPSLTVSPSASASASPSPSAPDLTAVIERTRSKLQAAESGGPDAPGPEGFMLAEAWPNGAAFVWETTDQRLCHVSYGLMSERACARNPLDPPVRTPTGVSPVGTLFTDGWVRLFAADHAEVVSATCGGEPVEVRRVGTAAGGARTLYTVRFPDYTKGSIGLRLSHDGTTSEDRLGLGDIGDRSCEPVA
ncbi:hypothetical protein ACWF95_11120 [Streptomyces vinaceus]|uniref:hypothetical protein n=1 Tax=Streptomyces vinaceus TaxID=1960 RepID=UPI0035E229FA